MATVVTGGGYKLTGTGSYSFPNVPGNDYYYTVPAGQFVLVGSIGWGGASVGSNCVVQLNGVTLVSGGLGIAPGGGIYAGPGSVFHYACNNSFTCTITGIWFTNS